MPKLVYRDQPRLHMRNRTIAPQTIDVSTMDLMALDAPTAGKLIGTRNRQCKGAIDGKISDSGSIDRGVPSKRRRITQLAVFRITAHDPRGAILFC